jgi:hypothetical protein
MKLVLASREVTIPKGGEYFSRYGGDCVVTSDLCEGPERMAVKPSHEERELLQLVFCSRHGL